MPNSPTPETYHLKRTAIAILRIVVGGIFIFSGFAKGIDIWGTEYKINDYITAFGWSWAEPFAGFAAISLALYEFVCGVLLLIGSFRRTIVGLLLAGMAFMLPLSAYIMIAKSRDRLRMFRRRHHNLKQRDILEKHLHHGRSGIPSENKQPAEKFLRTCRAMAHGSYAGAFPIFHRRVWNLHTATNRLPPLQIRNDARGKRQRCRR